MDSPHLKKRILIIDDESDYLYFMSFNLKARGTYDVEVVNKPEKALAIAQKFHPDITLLDLLMPKMNGAEVALQFKKDAALSQMPIIFMTGSNLDEIQKAEELTNGGSVPLIVKPATLETILTCIEKTLAA